MQDLSDVSTLMQLLNRLRDEESEIEQRRLKPFVQTYGLLATYDVRVTKEEQAPGNTPPANQALRPRSESPRRWASAQHP